MLVADDLVLGLFELLRESVSLVVMHHFLLLHSCLVPRHLFLIGNLRLDINLPCIISSLNFDVIILNLVIIIIRLHFNPPLFLRVWYLLIRRWVLR